MEANQSVKAVITNQLSYFKTRLKETWFEAANAKAEKMSSEFKHTMLNQIYFDKINQINLKFKQIYAGTDAMPWNNEYTYSIEAILRPYNAESKTYNYGYDNLISPEAINEAYIKSLENSTAGPRLKKVIAIGLTTTPSIGDILFPEIIEIIDALKERDDIKVLYSSRIQLEQLTQISLQRIKKQIDSFINEYTKYQSEFPDLKLKTYDEMLEEIQNEPEVVEAPEQVKEILEEVKIEVEKKSNKNLLLAAAGVAAVIAMVAGGE